MDARTGKKLAATKGLELYYDTQWQVWGLVDPDYSGPEESAWIAPADLKAMSREQFEQRITSIQQRKAH